MAGFSEFDLAVGENKVSTDHEAGSQPRPGRVQFALQISNGGMASRFGDGQRLLSSNEDVFGITKTSTLYLGRN